MKEKKLVKRKGLRKILSRNWQGVSLITFVHTAVLCPFCELPQKLTVCLSWHSLQTLMMVVISSIYLVLS